MRDDERDAYLRAFTAALEAQQAGQPAGLRPRVFVKDPDGVYLFANEVFAADQNLTPAGMVGRTDHAFYPAELATRYRNDDARVLASGQPLSVQEPYRSDGEIRMVQTTKLPVIGGDGAVIGVLGMFVDVTGQVEAERKDEQHRWMLAEGERLAHLGSWRYRFEDDHFEWSAELCRVFGVASHQVQGTLAGFLGCVHAEDREAVAAAFQRSAETGAPWQSEHRILSPGGIRHVVISGRMEQWDGQPARGIGAVQDITERKTRELDLRRLNWMLRAVSASDAALIRSASETELMVKVCEALTAENIFVLAWIGEPRDDEQRSIPIRAVAGTAAGYLDGIDVSWGDNERGRGPSGVAVRTGKPAVISDTGSDDDFSIWTERARAAGIGSSAALPIRVGQTVTAVMGVYSAERDAFGPDEIALLERFADNLGFGIEARRTRHAFEAAQIERETQVERFRRGMELTIEAISSTLESRDPYTAGHQQRVAEIAAAIAGEMALDPFRIEGLRLAALVHDLGKIQIPIQILSKPGKLTRIEFELIKTHPAAGYEILKSLDLPWPIAQAVHQHHEYLDGTGYPCGLKGDEIMLEARILTVADIVESMSAARPYRPALGIDAALAEITRQRGSQLDPHVVDACLKHFGSGRTRDTGTAAGGDALNFEP